MFHGWLYFLLRLLRIGSCIAWRFYTLIINELHTALEETDGVGKKGKEGVNGNCSLASCTYVPLQLEKQRCGE